MNTELTYLTWTTVLTGLLWIPYVLDRFATQGISDTVGYPDSANPQSPWARRLMKAHTNGVENLVVFAALVLAAQAAGVSNSVTAVACVVFFWARLAHAVVYAFAIPWLRTLAFLVGFGAQAVIAWQLLVG